ncbi:MAG: BadF/BadG/BcrA/BcrD ATPase family protein, partial [Paracoccaceae bacterium]
AGKLSENLSEFSSIKIVSDGYAALIGATGGKPGTLISIGTGTTGMRLMADGGSHALSGWGFPIGDQGSGAWLGLQTTQLLTQHIDGIYLAHPMSTEFFDKVILSLGGDRQSILDWQKNALPKDYASLARLIVEYAQRNDPHCVFLMEQAAGDIIGLAQTLLNLDSDKANETGQNGPLWLAGGLSGPMLPYLKALEPNCHWQLSTADALAGLYLLASGNAPAERTILRNSATVL